MPRHAEDWTPARAMLSAPYPLPNTAVPHTPLPEIVEQQNPLRDAAQAVHETEINNGQMLQPYRLPEDAVGPIDPVAQAAAAVGFPYDPNWRDRPPACLPVPYPPKTPEEQAELDRKRAILKRVKMIRRKLNAGRSVLLSSIWGNLEDDTMDIDDHAMLLEPTTNYIGWHPDHNQGPSTIGSGNALASSSTAIDSPGRFQIGLNAINSTTNSFDIDDYGSLSAHTATWIGSQNHHTHPHAVALNTQFGPSSFFGRSSRPDGGVTGQSQTQTVTQLRSPHHGDHSEVSTPRPGRNQGRMQVDEESGIEVDRASSAPSTRHTHGPMQRERHALPKMTLATTLLRQLADENAPTSSTSFDLMGGYNVETNPGGTIIRIPRNRFAREARARAQAQAQIQAHTRRQTPRADAHPGDDTHMVGLASPTSSADRAATSELVPSTRTFNVETIEHSVNLIEVNVEARRRVENADDDVVAVPAPPYQARVPTTTQASTPRPASPVIVDSFASESATVTPQAVHGKIEPTHDHMAVDAPAGAAAHGSWPRSIPLGETTAFAQDHPPLATLAPAQNADSDWDHAQYLEQFRQFQEQHINPRTRAQAQPSQSVPQNGPPVGPRESAQHPQPFAGVSNPAIPSTALPTVRLPTPTGWAYPARGLTIPSATPARMTSIPAIKACHNLLLARRARAQTRKAVDDHNLMMFVQAHNAGKRLAFVSDVNPLPSIGLRSRPVVAGSSTGPGAISASVIASARHDEARLRAQSLNSAQAQIQAAPLSTSLGVQPHPQSEVEQPIDTTQIRPQAQAQAQDQLQAQPQIGRVILSTSNPVAAGKEVPDLYPGYSQVPLDETVPPLRRYIQLVPSQPFVEIPFHTPIVGSYRQVYTQPVAQFRRVPQPCTAPPSVQPTRPGQTGQPIQARSSSPSQIMADNSPHAAVPEAVQVDQPVSAQLPSQAGNLPVEAPAQAASDHVISSRGPDVHVSRPNDSSRGQDTATPTRAVTLATADPVVSSLNVNNNESEPTAGSSHQAPPKRRRGPARSQVKEYQTTLEEVADEGETHRADKVRRVGKRDGKNSPT